MSGALLLLAFVVVATSKWRVVAELHHVVGGDRGWDPDSDLLSWYFASTDPQNCKTGLKLHLHVLPKDHDHHDNAPPVTKTVEAVAPSTPSSAYSLSYHYCHGTILALVLMFFVTMLLA
ncbi:hypothetical protein HN51_003860 [Arachis hypogaea]